MTEPGPTPEKVIAFFSRRDFTDADASQCFLYAGYVLGLWRKEVQRSKDLTVLVRRAAQDSCVTTADDPGCFYCDHVDHTAECPAAKLLEES